MLIDGDYLPLLKKTSQKFGKCGKFFALFKMRVCTSGVSGRKILLKMKLKWAYMVINIFMKLG
jgi:hypothetical protein